MPRNKQTPANPRVVSRLMRGLFSSDYPPSSAIQRRPASRVVDSDNSFSPPPWLPADKIKRFKVSEEFNVPSIDAETLARLIQARSPDMSVVQLNPNDTSTKHEEYWTLHSSLTLAREEGFDRPPDTWIAYIGLLEHCLKPMAETMLSHYVGPIQEVVRQRTIEQTASAERASSSRSIARKPVNHTRLVEQTQTSTTAQSTAPTPTSQENRPQQMQPSTEDTNAAPRQLQPGVKLTFQWIF